MLTICLKGLHRQGDIVDSRSHYDISGDIECFVRIHHSKAKCNCTKLDLNIWEFESRFAHTFAELTIEETLRRMGF